MKNKLIRKKSKEDKIKDAINKVKNDKIKFENKPSVYFIGSSERKYMLIIDNKNPKNFLIT
jgi:hypothetical protein